MGYGYYGSGMSSGLMAVAAAGVLAIIAVIAVIVLTIVACVKFLGKNGDRTSKLGRLFNFDHLFIETIMKVFYIMSVVGISVFYVWLVITSAIGGGFGGFFGALLGGAVMFFLMQLLCRLSFEITMAFVRMSSDVHAMRKTVVGDTPTGVQQSSGPSIFDSIAARIPKQPVAPAPNAAPVPPTTPAPSAPQQPVQQAPATPASSEQPAQAPADATVVMPVQPNADSDAWTCPLCGRAGNTAKFCPKCGCARP